MEDWPRPRLLSQAAVGALLFTVSLLYLEVGGLCTGQTRDAGGTLLAAGSRSLIHTSFPRPCVPSALIGKVRRTY